MSIYLLVWYMSILLPIVFLSFPDKTGQKQISAAVSFVLIENEIRNKPNGVIYTRPRVTHDT